MRVNPAQKVSVSAAELNEGFAHTSLNVSKEAVRRTSSTKCVLLRLSSRSRYLDGPLNAPIPLKSKVQTRLGYSD